MKRKQMRLFVVLTVLLFASSSIGFAADSPESFGKGPAQKFARGVFHILTSPFQVPKEIIQVSAETEPFWMASWKGPTVGIGNGVYMTGRQLFSGLFDIFTFFTPAGRNWEPVFEPSTLFPQV